MPTLDFEDQPAGTTVTTQYAVPPRDFGVVFPRGAFIDNDSAAHSGAHVLRAANPALEFNTGPLVIEFTAVQRHVHLFAGTTVSRTPIPGTLRAFNASGAQVAQDGPKPVAPRTFTTVFEVRTATAVITRVELAMVPTTEFEAIDDLRFEGTAPPPPPRPPVVQILSPFDNMDLDAPTVDVTGTVTGEALLPSATLTLQFPLPPGSTEPPFRTAILLSGQGTQRTFALPLEVGFGPQTLTIEAQNPGGTGSATIHFTYLTEPIRERFQSTGGTATYGNFQFAGDGGSCQIAVYERGAIAALAGTTTYVIVGDIFSKWISLRDPQNPNSVVGLLGCPVSEERFAFANSRVQDFVNGRIYAGLPSGVHYVLAPFVQAIDTLGGEAATGLPMADPRTSLGSNTWLFQQFARPGQPGLPSTLEIKGSPAVLYVERQGGDLSELSDVGLSLSADSPTLWLSFPCRSNRGPCNISFPPVDPPVEEAGCRFCCCTTYPFLCSLFDSPYFIPPEWKAILGDYVQTPMLGIVRNFHIASLDNPFSHQFSHDYNIFVRPLPESRNLFADNRDVIDIEVENYEVQAFFVEWANVGYGYGPNKGDLLFTSGRWIIDCGSSPYNSEIHPPFVLAYMRTETHNNRPATVAFVWVNGFYPGDPVEIDIYPPPRPSPDAIVTSSSQMGNDSPLDVDVQSTLVDSSFMRLRITASPRRVNVRDNGTMEWETGRNYSARWYVFWTEP